MGFVRHQFLMQKKIFKEITEASRHRSWHPNVERGFPRIKTFFPYIPLQLVANEGTNHLVPKGHRLITIRTQPKWTKIEIKEYLRKVYDINVVKVNSLNYDKKGYKVFRCTVRLDPKDPLNKKDEEESDKKI